MKPKIHSVLLEELTAGEHEGFRHFYLNHVGNVNLSDAEKYAFRLLDGYRKRYGDDLDIS